MNDVERGQEEYKKNRFGCLLMLVIILIVLALNKCSDKGYWRSNDGYDPSSVIDNPSRP
jgi:hypothetical protein